MKSQLEDDFDLEQFKKQFFEPQRKKSRLKKVKIVNMLSIAIVCLLVIVAYFSYKLVGYYADIKNSAELSERALEIINVSETAHDKSNEQQGLEESSQSDVLIASELIELPLKEEILELREQFENDDIVGYLSIENTKINYVVVQAADNEFYLNHDLFGKESVAGSIFIDADNVMYPFDYNYNSVIYGHNMRDGSFFHDLRFYQNYDYYSERNFVNLTTPYEDTVWEIFSFYSTDTNFNYIKTHFRDDDDFWELAQQMKQKSIYDTGVAIYRDDKILTLSTCTNVNDERFVLHARLIS